MTSTGSFNRKYRALTSRKFPREDERDVLRGARSQDILGSLENEKSLETVNGPDSENSVEKLSSLENERSPHLIFSTRNGSYIRQRQEAILRPTALSKSQPRLHSHNDSSTAFRQHNNASPTSVSSPTANITTSTTTTTTNINGNTRNNDDTQTEGKDPQRYSSRNPSKNLTDVNLLRINRHSDIITRKEEIEREGKRKTRNLNNGDSYHISHFPHSSTPPAGVKDVPRKNVSEDSGEVVMRRKVPSDKPPKCPTSDQTLSNGVKISRPSSLHSETNSFGFLSQWSNSSVNNAKSAAAVLRPKTSRPHSVVLDKDLSSDTVRHPSASVERSSSLRDVRRSSRFSEICAFWNSPTHVTVDSKRTVSLTNLSASPAICKKESTKTKNLVNVSSAPSGNSAKPDNDMQENVQNRTTKSVSQIYLQSLPQKETKEKRSPISYVSASQLFPPATSSPPSSSSEVDEQSIVNYDGSSLEVTPSLQTTVSHDASSEKGCHSSDVKTPPARSITTRDTTTTLKRLPLPTTDTTKVQLASPTKRVEPDDKERKARSRISSRHTTLQTATVTNQDMATSFVSCPLLSDSQSLSPTLKSTHTSHGMLSKTSHARLSQSTEQEPEGRKDSLSADAVLGDLDNALESHSIVFQSCQSTFSPPSIDQPFEKTVNVTTLSSPPLSKSAATKTSHSPEQTVNVTTLSSLPPSKSTAMKTSHSVSSDGSVNDLTSKPAKADTSSDIISKDLDVEQPCAKVKMTRCKGRRKARPTKVTKYEGSVKTVRRQIKPGHVDDLRELFKKQEEEQDKLVMRHRRRQQPSPHDPGSTDAADSSGSDCSTTSSDNEYDLEQAQKLHGSDYSSIPSGFSFLPSMQYEVMSCEEKNTSDETITNEPTQTNEDTKDAIFKGQVVETVLESIPCEVDEKCNVSTEKEETAPGQSTPSSSKVHSPELGPDVESTSINITPPQASVCSLTHTTDSPSHTTSTTLPVSNPAVVETRLSTLHTDGTIENKDKKTQGNPIALLEKTDDPLTQAEPQTANNSSVQSLTLTSKSRRRRSRGSNPAGTSSEGKTAMHQETPQPSSTHPMMDDCNTTLLTSPPPGATTGGGKREMVEGKDRGGKSEPAGKLDGEGPPLLSWPDDCHHHDTCQEDEGGRRQSPGSPAGKVISQTTSPPTPSRLQKFESHNQFLSVKRGEEKKRAHHDVMLTSCQTPPHAVSDKETTPMDQTTHSSIDSHSSSFLDTEKEGSEHSSVDFLSILEDIHLDTNSSFSVETAHRARQLHSKDVTDKDRNRARSVSPRVRGSDFRQSRTKGNEVFNVNKREDSGLKRASTGLLSLTSVTVSTNDMHTALPDSAKDDSAVHQIEDTGQQEMEKSLKDKAEADQPDGSQSLVSNAAMSVPQDRRDNARDMNTSDIENYSDASEKDTIKTMSTSTTKVKDISIDSKDSMSKMPSDDQHKTSQPSCEKRFKMDVVAGNIRLKQNSPTASVAAEDCVQAEDENTAFLTIENHNRWPSKTSSQVLSRSHPQSCALDERHRQPMSSKRQGKSTILSTAKAKHKSEKDTSLPQKCASVSSAHEAKNDSHTSTSVVTTMNHNSTMSPSQHSQITDKTVVPVSKDTIQDNYGEQQADISRLNTQTDTFTSDVTVGISLQDVKKINEDGVSLGMQTSSHVASSPPSDDSHQTQSNIVLNLDSKKTRKHSVSTLSSSEDHDENNDDPISDLSTKEQGEQEKHTSPSSTDAENSSHEVGSHEQYFGIAPLKSKDRKSSKMLVLNTSLHHSTSHDSMSMSNISFGDNDSQYGSQTSKATSVGDASPTDERFYRIVHPDTSLHSSSILPVNPPPPQNVIYSSLERKPCATVECQSDSVNHSQDGIFSEHNNDHVSPIWKTGRLSVSDPDLSQSLFGKSLSTWPPDGKETKTEKQLSESEHSMQRMRSSASDSDDDSGVEGGRHYKSEAKLDIGVTKKRANSTGSLSNVHLSLLPHSPTISSLDYPVSSLQPQRSEEGNKDSARDQSKHMYRVSKMKTAEDVASQLEGKHGPTVLKTQSRSGKQDENSRYAFKVLHTQPSRDSPMMDEGDLTEKQTTPNTAQQYIDGSFSNTPPWTCIPAGVQQHHSTSFPPDSTDTNTTVLHWTNPQHLLTTVTSVENNNPQREVGAISRTHSSHQELTNTKPGSAGSVNADLSGLTYLERNQDREGSLSESSAPRRHFSSDGGSSMACTVSNRVYNVSTTAHLRHRPVSLQYDNIPDYDNIPLFPDGKHHVGHTSTPSSALTTTPYTREEERISLQEIKPRVTSPLPEPKQMYHDRAWQTQATSLSSDNRDNVHSDTHPRSYSNNLWSSEQQWRAGSSATSAQNSSSHSDQLHYARPVLINEDIHHTSRPAMQSADTPDDKPDTFQREVYEETSYEFRQDTTHLMPEETLSPEEKDLRVLHGKILIQNRLDDSRTEEDFLHNMNIFDSSFHMDKDNPLYQSDPDIYKSLEMELQQQEEQRKSQAIGQEVTQDVTWETVERVAQKHKEEQSQRPRRKQNLSTLLLSKLSSIHSRDIHQHIDVKHHHEDIFGDLHLTHADGSQAQSSDTSNFDSVHENIELLLKEGKAHVIIKVIAERIVPIDREFHVWRKTQAIVTRNIEIDLHATEQRRRLYQHVMDTGGRLPGTWTDDSGWNDVSDNPLGDVSEAWTGGPEEEGGGGAMLRSSRRPGQEAEERQLSSLETLRLFSQILGVAEGEEERGWADGGRGGQTPSHCPPSPRPSAMDLLY